MRRIIKIIAKDKELQAFLMQIFKWRDDTRFDFCRRTVCSLADRIREKYGVEIEVYT
jgi:hypothetical protein